MREYAPPETVKKCKMRLEEAQKKVNARLRTSGRQTNIVNIDNVDEQDKHFAHSIQDNIELIPKPDYLYILRKQFGVTEKSAIEEYDRRLKRGVILERHGLVEVKK